MKRCPECRRDYYDDSLSYCLDDGKPLLFGPAAVEIASDGADTAVFRSEAQTAIFRDPVQDPQSVNSIAVLPFRNVSTDAENEYFCEGLADELLTSLAKIPGLRVAARSSSFSFRNTATSLRDIASALNVINILEGSVRKSGDRIRISLQLVSAADGYQLWAERYDRQMRDIFDLQEEIAIAVIDALEVKLTAGDKDIVARRETENTEAYRAYLKGRYLRYAKNDHAAAADAYQTAVKLDPSHAPSWLGLAESYMLRTHYALVRSADAGAKLREALRRAETIQGVTAESLYIQGFMAFIERDWRSCDEAYKRSLKMDASNPRTLGTYGIINSVLGRAKAAMSYFERSRDADPLAAYPYAMTGGGLMIMRMAADALPYLEQALAFEKDNSLALWMSCEGLVASGDPDAAVKLVEGASDAPKRSPFLLGILGCALAAAGRRHEARAVLHEIQTRPPSSPVLIHEACLLGALGEKGAAFDLLSRAVDECAPMAYYTGLPCFDSLRGDSRFEAHIQSLNIPTHKV